MPSVDKHLNEYRPSDMPAMGYKALCENLREANFAMQALTEKLLTQNQRLSACVDALNDQNNQAHQIIRSTGIAILFVDAQLAVQFFTPALLTHFNITPGDLGRPLADLGPQDGNSDLVGSARTVLANGVAQNQLMEAGQGRYCLRRILAYRLDQAIEGVVITFMDVSESKAAEKVPHAAKAGADNTSVAPARASDAPASLAGSIVLVVDAARELRELLGALLTAEKYQVITVSDGAEALAWISRAGVQPDLILTDYSLGDGMNGLGLVEQIRQALRRNLPAIIFTGDTCAQTASHVFFQHCTLLTKPSKPNEVAFVVHQLLVQGHLNAVQRTTQLKRAEPSVIYVVESDSVQRTTLRQVMESDGHRVLEFASGAEFLAHCQQGVEACLLLDAHLPDMSCIDVLNRLRADGNALPTLVMGDESGVFLAVEAMKAGAADYVDKPFNRTDLLNATALALEQSRDANNLHAWEQDAIDHVANLTARQRQIMDLVLAGWPSKNIASELGISQRTVENHRASIMTRTHSKSIPALARLAMAATHRKPAG